MAKWTFTQHQPNTHKLQINDLLNDQQRVALMSDLHWDNPHCMLDRLSEDLQAALDADAPIMLFGESINAMITSMRWCVQRQNGLNHTCHTFVLWVWETMRQQSLSDMRHA
jgi:hypothetical protein